MADSKDLPCHPMRWINDSDRNEFAPNGHVLPPQGSIDLPGLTKLEYAAIHLRVEHEDCPDWLNEMIQKNRWLEVDLERQREKHRANAMLAEGKK